MLPGRALVAEISKVSQAAVLGQRKVFAAGQFFDVDVLEGDHSDVLDEARGAVNIPDPRVLQSQVEVNLTVCAAGLEIDVVGQIEPSLRLDNVAEKTDYVPVLTVELQLHVGFIVFKVLGTHSSILHYLLVGTRQVHNSCATGRSYSSTAPVKCQLVRW